MKANQIEVVAYWQVAMQYKGAPVADTDIPCPQYKFNPHVLIFKGRHGFKLKKSELPDDLLILL